MNPKEYREFVKAYQSVYEQQQAPQKIGVKTDNPYRTLQQMVDRQKLGGKVVIPKGELPLANSYEPEGEQLQEKPGDGYLGPTPIPNPIRLAKDAVDATNRANQKKVDAVNSVLPGSASMPKHTYFNKGPSAASQKYLGLKNSYEPEGDLVDEGLLGSLDNVIRNTAGSIGGTIGKNKGQQTGIPGGGAVGEILGRNKGTSTYDKVTKPVRDLKLPGLNNSYEPEGDLIEDLEERRKQLARARREGIEGFKQRISDRVKANRKRLAKKREKEQLRRELKSELKN